MANPNANPAAGSHSIGGRRRRRPAWLLLLAAVLSALLAVVWSRLDQPRGPTPGLTSTSPSAAAGTSRAPSNAAPSAPAAAPAPAGAPGAAADATGSGGAAVGSAGSAGAGTGEAGSTDAPLTAGDTALLPVAAAAELDGSLCRFVDRPVRAERVRVLSVPADEGFWVGTSERDRIWVQLTGAGESPYDVDKGDRVDFTGEVVRTPPGFPDRVGVSDAEGGGQVRDRCAHLAVPQNAVRLYP